MNLEKISTFLCWAGFTFISHLFAKTFLSNTEKLIENVILLTTLQMACGAVIFVKSIILGPVISVNH